MLIIFFFVQHQHPPKITVFSLDFISAFSPHTCFPNAFVFVCLFSFFQCFSCFFAGFSGEYLENKCNQNYMGVDFSVALVNFKA